MARETVGTAPSELVVREEFDFELCLNLSNAVLLMEETWDVLTSSDERLSPRVKDWTISGVSSVSVSAETRLGGGGGGRGGPPSGGVRNEERTVII